MTPMEVPGATRRGQAGRPGRTPILASLLLLVTTAAGCGGGVAAPRAGTTLATPAGAGTLVRSELYFGRLRPDRTVVSDAEWQAFVTEHVTPRFPDGFTVLDATGQYRERSGQVIREPTKVLVILHPPAAGSRAAIEELRQLYRKLFDQESVLLIEVGARVSF